MRALFATLITWVLVNGAMAQDNSPYLIRNLSEGESLSFRMLHSGLFLYPELVFEIEAGGILRYRDGTRQLSPEQIRGLDLYTEYVSGLNDQGGCTKGVSFTIKKAAQHLQ